MLPAMPLEPPETLPMAPPETLLETLPMASPETLLETPPAASPEAFPAVLPGTLLVAPPDSPWPHDPLPIIDIPTRSDTL